MTHLKGYEILTFLTKKAGVFKLFIFALTLTSRKGFYRASKRLRTSRFLLLK